MRGAAGTLATGAALAGCGVLLGSQALVVPGLTFVLLALVAAGWALLAGNGATLTRELEAVRVVEEEPMMLRLGAGAGLAPFCGGELREPLLGEAIPLGVGKRGARADVRVRFSRRGRRELKPARLVLRDPLGIVEREVAATGPAEVLVLPRLEPVEAAAAGGQRRRGHGQRLLTVGAEAEIDGLRPYEPGSAATRIHWPAYARGAGLLERHLRPEVHERTLIVLDLGGPATDDDRDAAVRAAASIAHALARGRGCALVLPGERRALPLGPNLAGWPRAHALLALAEPHGRTSLGRGRHGAVVQVAAAPPAEPLGRAGAAVLVVTRPLPGRRALFEVAGCHAYALPPAAVAA